LEDPYQTLGLPRNASQDDIRDAYRKLAKRHHPDLNPGNAKAEEEFKKVSSANELLSDPGNRGRFDRGEIDAAGQEKASGPSYRDHADREAGRRYSQAGRQTAGWSAEDLGDIFGSMFGEGGQRGSGPVPGRDENYTLSTQLLDAINGATRRLTLPDGRTLDVKIPPATVEGQMLRLHGQGGEGHNGAPRGDAFIAIHIEPHRYFVRDGNDVRLMLPVTLSEAVIGGSVQVPTPRGPVMMRIPPHSDSGTELRLRGRGVPEHRGKPAGDLYATLRIIIGTQDKSLEEFLTGWKPENPVNPRRSMEEAP
jgi:DnaJ-class molecular chaperone